MDLIQIATIAILFFITLVNYFKYKDVLYPPVIHGALWFLITAMFILHRDFFLPISNVTYLVIMTGVAAFSIGSFIATWKYDFKIRPIDMSQMQVSNLIPQFLFWIAVIGLPFFLWKGYVLGTDGPYDNFFINLRSALTDQERSGGYGILAYLVTISFLSAFLQLLLFFRRQARSKLVISYAVAFTYALFSTGRTFFMMLFIASLGILLIVRKMSVIKSALLLLLLGVLIFVGFGMLLGKGASTSVDLAGNAATMLAVGQVYMLGSIPALDVLIQQEPLPEWGLNTFRTLFALTSKIVDNIPVRPLVQEYVMVPMPTNVYTVYQPYFLDFTFIGLFGIQFILGSWHGFLYRNATRGKTYYVFLYALFLYPLFMQFFEDQYLSLLSMWVQYLLLSLLIFYRVNIFNGAITYAKS